MSFKQWYETEMRLRRAEAEGTLLRALHTTSLVLYMKGDTPVKHLGVLLDTPTTKPAADSTDAGEGGA